MGNFICRAKLKFLSIITTKSDCPIIIIVTISVLVMNNTINCFFRQPILNRNPLLHRYATADKVVCYVFCQLARLVYMTSKTVKNQLHQLFPNIHCYASLLKPSNNSGLSCILPMIYAPCFDTAWSKNGLVCSHMILKLPSANSTVPT